MSSFKEFLEKEKQEADKKGHSYILGDCVSVCSLGEWVREREEFIKLKVGKKGVIAQQFAEIEAWREIVEALE